MNNEISIAMAEYLQNFCVTHSIPIDNMQFPICNINPTKIKVIMINEVPSQNPDDGFYSTSDNPNYMKTTLSLFNNAGVHVDNINDILNLGIYITTAVKSPKNEYSISTDTIKANVPILKAELELFSNLKVIMLMGDVAKKSVNMIHKEQNKKNIIPAESTYKIRSNQYYWNKSNVRVFPSYIMTGGNILIEKSKCEMISDDIKNMMQLI